MTLRTSLSCDTKSAYINTNPHPSAFLLLQFFLQLRFFCTFFYKIQTQILFFYDLKTERKIRFFVCFVFVAYSVATKFFLSLLSSITCLCECGFDDDVVDDGGAERNTSGTLVPVRRLQPLHFFSSLLRSFLFLHIFSKSPYPAFLPS